MRAPLRIRRYDLVPTTIDGPVGAPWATPSSSATSHTVGRRTAWAAGTFVSSVRNLTTVGRKRRCGALCDLAAVIATAVANVKRLAEGVTVHLEAPSPFTATCDARVIGRVVENLVGNGLKHTKAGGTLLVTGQGDEAGLRVTVRDDGPGIAPEFRERIFEKFGTLEARQGQHYHSVGLGLAFSKLAVEAHGGRIGVDTEEGRGSSFWFTLPAAR